jgi:MFS family permease
MHDETSPRYAGWRVVLACFLLALSIFGFALYGQGIYLVELQRLNGWPASLISDAITLSLPIGNVIVIFTDEIVARLGLKRLVLTGIASLAGSMALLAFASAPWTLYAAFALMSLGWVGMGTVIISAVVGSWFVKRRGLAISGTIGALRPGLIGLVRGWSGDYGAALLLSIVLEVIAAAIVIGRRVLPRA